MVSSRSMASARECWSGCEVELIAGLLIDGIIQQRPIIFPRREPFVLARGAVDHPVLKIDRLACQIDRGADAYQSPLELVRIATCGSLSSKRDLRLLRLNSQLRLAVLLDAKVGDWTVGRTGVPTDVPVP